MVVSAFEKQKHVRLTVVCAREAEWKVTTITLDFFSDKVLIISRSKKPTVRQRKCVNLAAIYSAL